MEQFYYSQEITADDINGIAVDLGAQSFSYFKNGVSYAVDQLNEISKALASKGITSNGNKFQISVSNGNVVIGTGVGIFESGKKVTLNAPLTLPYKQGELYFENDETANMVSAKIGTLPSNDYIHLATLNADGSITDKRVISKAKVSNFNAENAWNATQRIDFKREVAYSNTSKTERFSLNMDGEDFKYVVFVSGGNNPKIGLLDVKTGKSTFADSDTDDESGIYEDGTLYFVKNTAINRRTILRFVSFEWGKINLEIEFKNTSEVAGTLILC